MRRYSQKNSHSTLAELNVTPLLDLAFVLLVIFMITTPLMDNSINLTVPSSTATTNAVNPDSVETISLSRDGVMKLDDRPLGFDELGPALAELKQQKPDLAVIVRSDKDLPVQKLVDVMDILQKTGIAKVGVATQKPSAAK
jgi:biopolymer transport protein ExbD